MHVVKTAPAFHTLPLLPAPDALEMGASHCL